LRLFLGLRRCGCRAGIGGLPGPSVSQYASGSGIPHVEAALNEDVSPAPPGLIPVKFVVGVLAIGAGLALGREGPSVQMRVAIAHFVRRVSRRVGRI
jgi:chloride channel protein, CIC family